MENFWETIQQGWASNPEVTDNSEVLENYEVLQDLKGSSNKNNIPKVKLKLIFAGVAEDFIWQDTNQERQKCLGTLSVMDDSTNQHMLDSNGESFIFKVVSGPQQNGLLPNGEYKVTKDIETTTKPFTGRFPDENGFCFKMPLQPVPAFKSFKKLAPRNLLRIHPEYGIDKVNPAPPNYKYGSYYPGNSSPKTEGCIAICSGWIYVKKFYNLIQPYILKNGSIMLTVDVAGNYNLKNQIGSRQTYKNLY